MARYNRRDRLMHWVRRDQPAHQHCTHACCRGYHEHPANWPVVVSDRRLRGVSDEKLAERFSRLSRVGTSQARTAENQILAEMQRRDDAERLKRQRSEAVAANRAARQMERESEAERIRLDVEAKTMGYLVTAQGRARGISDEEILTGREAVFHRYATDEAKEYFRANPRPTGAYFRGRDTRVHERYTERPKRDRRRPAGRFR